VIHYKEALYQVYIYHLPLCDCANVTNGVIYVSLLFLLSSSTVILAPLPEMNEMMMTCADETELDNPVQVETIRHRLLQALCYLYEQHRETPTYLLIGRTFTALTAIRSASIAFDSFSARASLNAFAFFL